MDDGLQGNKSEDWLALFWWSLESIVCPSPSNLLRTFEAWDYDHRLRAQLRQLERAKFIERDGAGRAARLSLTDQGQRAVWGGVDPGQRWRRSWDGVWRLLMFDLPSKNQQVRLRLWRWLRAQRFGYLQNSVWISPDALGEEAMPLKSLKLTPESLTVIEGRPTGSDTDADLVRSAWDFERINGYYQDVLDLGRRGLELGEDRKESAAKRRQWLAAERQAWLQAMRVDPLLPEALLPLGYLGREAWKQRQAVFRRLAAAPG
jgi:phenylacetic acid degradation operon negative regulatory protein